MKALSIVSMLLALAVCSHALSGLLIPLYSYPTDSNGAIWKAVKDAAIANPSIPFVVIINPNNGPGSSKDSEYASAVTELVNAGCKCVGYISTRTSSVSLSTVTGNMNKYKSWYPDISGFFLDEMAYDGNHEAYYASATSHAISIGYGYTIGNPGTSTTQSYFNTVNNTVIFESEPIPNPSVLNQGFPISGCSMIGYNIPGSKLNQTYISDITQYVSLIYITDAPTSDPYQVLPTYFNQLITRLLAAPPAAPIAPFATPANTPSASEPSMNTSPALMILLLASTVLYMM